MQKKFTASRSSRPPLVRVEVLELVLQHAIERERQFREGSGLSTKDIRVERGNGLAKSRHKTGGFMGSLPQIGWGRGSKLPNDSKTSFMGGSPWRITRVLGWKSGRYFVRKNLK